MAQMPIQSMSARADPFVASPARVIPRAAYLHDAGAISGGRLRPGAVDQELFKAHLAAARTEAAAAPPAPLPSPVGPGVTTLSPAQLAALGIDPSRLPGAETLRPAAPGTAAREPMAMGTGGAAAGSPDAGTTGSAGNSLGYVLDPTAAQPSPGTAEGVLEARTEAAPPSPAAPRQGERGPFPGARRGADGAWEMTRLPDKDEREMLYGQEWRVVESEESRRLFLGPDGEFGWDDFLDLINPLQHIPFVNLAYRAVSGDEIYGAARMVDVALGPLAGASTALDLAFRDITGESMAHNAVAALFGPGDAAPGDAPMSDFSVSTASAALPSDAGPIRRGSNR
jgi:hypothetical protein